MRSSSKQDGELETRQEAKRRILKEYPDISEQFVLSITVEQKIPKVSELGPIHATAEQQEEMEKLPKKNKT